MKLLEQNRDFQAVAIQSIFDNSTDGIAFLDENGKVVEWSKGYEKISGFTAQDAFGKYIWNLLIEIIPQDERDNDKIIKIVSDIKKTLINKEIITFNRTIIDKKTKQIKFLQVKYFPVEIDEITKMGIICSDITDRITIEKNLATQNIVLEQIINKRTKQLEFVNQQLTSTNEELSTTIEELASTNNKLEIEIKNKNNLLQLLKNSEKIRQNFISQALEGIVIIEEGGTILEWNKKTEEITGISKENAISNSIWKILIQFLIDKTTGKLFRSQKMFKDRVFKMFNFDNNQIYYREECQIKVAGGEIKIVDLSMFVVDFSPNNKIYGLVFNDITEKNRNAAELLRYRNQLEMMVLAKTKELTDSQEMLTSLSNNLPGGVIFQLISDYNSKKLKFDFISDTVYDMFGFTANELTKNSKLLFDIMHPDDKNFLINLEPDSYDHKFKDIETRMFLKSGEMKWIHIRWIMRKNENNIKVFEGFMLDITKRKLDELELDESRNRQLVLNEVLQTMHAADNIPFAIQIVLESIGKYANASRAYIFEKTDDPNFFIKKYEWCKDDIIPAFDNMRNLNHKILEDWLLAFEELGYYSVSNVKELEKIHYGTLKIYNIKSILNIPIWDNGKVSGFVGLHQCTETRQWKQTDIQLLINLSHIISTANKRFLAEKSIFMSQQTLRTVMDNIDANIYVTDFDTNDILFANKHIKEQFGQDIEGKKCWSVLQKGVGVCADCSIQKLLTGEGLKEDGTLSYEKWFPHVNAWYYCKKSAIEWIDGRIVHMEYSSNVSDRKEAEQQLILAKEKAIGADNLKSAFLANMSHEIRTPMNGILGFASLIQLETDEKISPRTAQYAQIMYDNCNSLLQLLDDIIDISKLESKQMKIVKNLCNINSLLSDMLILYQQLLDEKGKSENVKLIFEKSQTDETVMVDYVRLKQIITNLISNSIKFTDKGSITFGFNRHQKDYLLFYVKDTGIGIPESYKEVIFDRFRRVEEHADKNITGTGLGLAISKNLVEIMDGDIWYESEENVGSTFFFTLKV